MNLTFKDIERLLRKNGWYLVRSRGSHRMYKKTGNPGLVVVDDHGSKAISKNVIKQISKVVDFPLE